MQLDEEKVLHIARLARIKLSGEEASALKKELSRILEWVRQLEEFDTSAVEPMRSVVAMQLKTRPDRVDDGGIADDIVKNAPAREDHFFVVPKVVE
jgi:aspartyl-tRNA(Asn)/glutamyl-tRNA(Gln) amidotransferase subunit C